MRKKILFAVLLLIVLIPIISIGGTIFSSFVYIISLLGINEFMCIRENKKCIPIFIKFLSFISISFLFFSNIGGNLFLSIDYRILSGIFLLFLIPTILYHDSSLYSINDSFYLMGGILFLGISFSLLVVVRSLNFELFMYLFMISFFSDSYAFITGSLIGKKRLLFDISPSKTIEGMIGGVVFGTFIPTLYYITVVNPQFNLLFLIFITLFLCVLGQIGDLCFSSIKRYFNKKDFSDLLPGHGGILDRCDSMIFIMLGFMFFINIIGG